MRRKNERIREKKIKRERETTEERGRRRSSNVGGKRHGNENTVRRILKSRVLGTTERSCPMMFPVKFAEQAGEPVSNGTKLL